MYQLHRNKNKKLDKIRQQKNMFQMREQDKNLEEELREMETGHLPKKDFKVVIVKVTKELRRRRARS